MKYSVADIDAMRELIRWSYPDGVPYVENQRAAEIENRLRTYMQNGTSLAELREHANKAALARQQAHAS